MSCPLLRVFIFTVPHHTDRGLKWVAHPKRFFWRAVKRCCKICDTLGNLFGEPFFQKNFAKEGSVKKMVALWKFFLTLWNNIFWNFHPDLGPGDMGIQFDDFVYFSDGVGKKKHQADFLFEKFLNKEYRNTVSQFLKGNASSIRVHFPTSFVGLPECIWQTSQQGWSWLGNYQCWFEIASWQQDVGKDVLAKLARDRKRNQRSPKLVVFCKGNTLRNFREI